MVVVQRFAWYCRLERIQGAPCACSGLSLSSRRTPSYWATGTGTSPDWPELSLISPQQVTSLCVRWVLPWQVPSWCLLSKMFGGTCSSIEYSPTCSQAHFLIRYSIRHFGEAGVFVRHGFTSTPSYLFLHHVKSVILTSPAN